VTAITSLPGYYSISDTKEKGAVPLPIPANEWTAVPLPVKCFVGRVNQFNGQFYFEDVTGVKLAVRLHRGTNDDTAVDDRVVKGPSWGFMYKDDDYIPADKPNRSFEVWADKPCTLQSRIIKVTAPVTADGTVR